MLLKVHSALLALFLTALPVASAATTLASAQQSGGTRNTGAVAQPEKFALLVGINEYRNMPGLRGSVQDVRDMKEVLTSKFGFPEENVRLLADSAATKGAILDAFRRLIEQVKKSPGAIVVFQFSGHGSSVKDENGDEPDGEDETLVAFSDKDSASKDAQITDDEFDSLIGELGLYTPNITIILDSSHSGGVEFGGRSGATDITPTGNVPQGTEASPSKPGPTEPATTEGQPTAKPAAADKAQFLRGVSYVMIKACLPNEMSFESRHQPSDGVKYNGLLTYHLVKALRSATPEATWRDVFSVVAAAVSGENPAQHPQLEGNLRQRIFSDISSFAAAVAQDYIRVFKVQGSTLTVAAGTTQGLRRGDLLRVYAPGALRLEGDENKLAEAKVTAVSDFTATAALDGAASVPDNAKVVLVRSNYESVRLRLGLKPSGASGTSVVQDKVTQEVAQQLKGSGIVEVVALHPVSSPSPRPQNVGWDLTIVSAKTGDGKDGLCLADESGQTVAEMCVALGEQDGAEKLARGVEMIARQDTLRALGNETSPIASKVRLTVLRVTEVSPQAGDEVREEVVSSEQFFIPAGEGEKFRFIIENQSDVPLYVTLFDLSTSGNIDIVHPLREANERLAPGASVKTAVLMMTEPAGKETFKLIASTVPTDLRFLATQESTRGTPKVKSPLERLLGRAFRVEDVAGVDAAEEVDDWATAQVDFVIRRVAESANPSEAAELIFWDSSKSSADQKNYSEYLAKYPSGRFAAVARRRLAELRAGKIYEEADVLALQRKYPEGLAKAEEALKIVEAALGPDDPGISRYLNLVGWIQLTSGDYAKAEATLKRSLELQTRANSRADLPKTLMILSALYALLGKYEEAEATLVRRLTVLEKSSGEEDIAAAEASEDLADLYRNKDDNKRAEQYYRRALAVREKVLGAEDPSVALTLVSLAELYTDTGELSKAEAFYQRAVAIQSEALGPKDSHLVVTLNNLGVYYERADRRAQAVETLEKALAAARASEDAESTATVLRNLGRQYRELHKYEKSLSFFRQALDLAQGAKDDKGTIDALNLIGGVYKQQQQHQRALDYFRQALALARRTKDEARRAVSLYNCADAYLKLGDAVTATPLYFAALETLLKADRKDMRRTEFDLDELLRGFATALKVVGEYGEATKLLELTLKHKQELLGPDHLDVAVLLRELADLYAVRGDLKRAVPLLESSNAIRTKHLGLLYGVSSDEGNREYLAATARETSYTVSFNARYAPRSPQATRLALSTILQRKGRSFDIVGDSMRALQSRLDPRDQSLFKQLGEARARLASMVFSDSRIGRDASKEEIEQLELEVGRLESSLASRAAELRPQSEPVKVEDVQRLIPDDAALVEFIRYTPYDGRAGLGREWQAPRYAAYVLRRAGSPAWADLGAASVIDPEVVAFRKSLSNPSSRDFKLRGRALHQQLMAKLLLLAGKASTLLLAPDGTLDLLPFGALVDARGRYLVESYSFTYLTSGRDLLRLKEQSPSREPPLVIADPDFDTSEPNNSAPLSATSSGLGGLPAQRFSPLPGTALEAAEVGRALNGARVLTRGQATETALRQAHGPAVLHIATAGYFLADDTTGGAVHRGAADAEARAPLNPLLRAGLAFAGANRLRSGSEDGVLTALEASGLDLSGTKLAVLSACDTGVGQVRNGDGVYGMRWAFMAAGTESVVTSLWKIDDEATRELMSGFYRELHAGSGRGAALRSVQLRVLRDPRLSHPYYWAAFTLTGQWSALDPALFSGGEAEQKGGAQQ